MDVDLDGNLTGFMSCDEYYEWKKETECTAIQNSLIEEDERNEKIRNAKKSGEVKSKVRPPTTECADCVRLAARVEVLEHQNTKLNAERDAKDTERDAKDTERDAEMKALKANMQSLMEHVAPANEIRLRVLLYHFRDYIESRLGPKPTHLSWPIFLENIASNPKQLQLSRVSAAAVRLLSSDFKSLSLTAHRAPADLIIQAVDAVLVENKRQAYREIFDTIYNASTGLDHGLDL